MKKSRRLGVLPAVILAVLIVTANGARAQYPPEDATQQRVLKTVTEFARQYVDHLPDFICNFTTEHWISTDSGASWKLEAKVQDELSFHGNQASYKSIAVNDRPGKNVSLWTVLRDGGWADLGPGFREILAGVFDPKYRAELRWHGWDYVRGKRVFSFEYHVALDDSDSVRPSCTMWVFVPACKKPKYGYRGVVYVDQESLDIVRITHISETLKPDLSFIRSVDYERATIGGASYLLPITDRLESSGRLQFRNESTYESFRKFAAESVIRIADDSTPAPAGRSMPSKSAPDKASKGISPSPTAVEEAVDCFELRDRIASIKPAGLYRAAVDAMFNNSRDAEKELLAVARRGNSDAPFAHLQLAELYERLGQVNRAIEQRARLTDEHSRQKAQGVLAALAKYPAQSVERRGYSRFGFKQSGDGIIIPVLVNGRAAQFLIDTGAGISVVDESQAKQLAITVNAESFPVTDVVGQELPCRLGIAGKLEAGSFRLRNVPFCVTPDRRRADDAANGGGEPDQVLGLPVLLAFETLRWSSQEPVGKEQKGTFEIGFPPARRDLARSNVCFVEGGLAVDARLSVKGATGPGKHIALDLDTGNDVTFLYPNFAGDFEDAMKSAGETEPYQLNGVSASREVDSRKLAEPSVRVAELDFDFRQLSVLLSSPLEPDCPGCYGNVGLDLLNRAQTVTLDFKAMKLTLDR